MLTARPLSIWDAAFCWRLANDPDVRASAVDRRPPTWVGHCKWMLAWLFKRDRQAWVIRSGRPVFDWWVNGNETVYWEYRTAGLARVGRDGTVSIEVLPSHRGQGVGIRGVRIATEYAERHGWDTPTAHIRDENGASIGLFAKAGYRMAGASRGWVRMERA